jgi:uncharacterized protein YndB with AHSA1/START domain
MHRTLVQRHPGETESAPVRIEHEIELAATPQEAFAVLADHSSWPRWFRGMRRVRVDGPHHGAGALRTVWMGPARIQEQFVTWREDERLTFDIVDSNLPGLLAMKEDWSLTASGSDASKLRIVITAEPSGLGRAAPWLVRMLLERATAGAAGLAEVFRGSRPLPQHLAAVSA